MQKKLIVTPAEFEQEMIAYARQRAAVVAMKKAALQEKLATNADHQNRKRMTPNERARDALMRTAKAIKTFNDAKSGSGVTSFEEALKKARTLAHKADRDNE